VGIVAAVTELGGLVALFDHLGEAGRPRSQIAVTGEAQVISGREYRLLIGLFSRVKRCRAVAGFAADGSMVRAVLLRDLVFVAFRTGLPARVLDLVRRDHGDRGGSIVAEISEGFRNEVLPYQDHGRADDEKDGSHLEHLIRKLPKFQGALRAIRESPPDSTRDCCA